MRHSRLSLIVLAIIISAISLFAQTDSVKCNSQIQFHLINGYSLSYLSMLSPATGVRFKADLGLNGSSSNSDHLQNYFNSGSNSSASDEQRYTEDGSSSSQSLNLVVNYLWFSNITKEMRLYLGVGPMISFSRYDNEHNQNRSASSFYEADKSYYETTSSSFGLGFQAILGIECFITEKISLNAEFNLNGTYNWNHSMNKSGSQQTGWSKAETTVDGNSWNYGLNNLKIGVSFNF